jgi:hypothetical protein
MLNNEIEKIIIKKTKKTRVNQVNLPNRDSSHDNLIENKLN